MAGTISVILNPSSGSGRSGWCARIRDALAGAGFIPNIGMAETELEILVQARAAAARHLAVVAGGGDGTVSAVAGVLAGTGVPLGVLPLGTLNHFARDVGLPADPMEALGVVMAGRARAADICEVNGRAFVNNSSLGLYPALVRARERQQRMGHGKWPAFAWAALAAFRRYPFLKLRFELRGRTIQRTTPFVNNAYKMEGLEIGTRGALDRGQMCLYVLHRTGRWGLLQLAATALCGRLSRAGNFDALCVTELAIDSPHRRLLVAADGEVRAMEPPLHYRMRPGALRVLAP